MQRILISGATGNVGVEVIRALPRERKEFQVVAAERTPKKFPENLKSYVDDVVHFDFEDAASFGSAFQGTDTLFLLRPPQISDVKKYFTPLVEAARKAGIQHIVFLSVQGADSNTVIPHYKIEQLIIQSGIAYTFLRPAYFFQNYLGNLHKDLVEKSEIFLPAGQARFTLVDTRDIGAVTAEVILHTQEHAAKAYDLTNEELLNFGEMANILSRELGRNIRYRSPNLLKFFLRKKKEGVPTPFILVMIMLHYLPRFSKPPQRSDHVRQITGKDPVSFAEFVRDYQEKLSR
jgi:uncharacterized protein YbjT (DUF2867 family)